MSDAFFDTASLSTRLRFTASAGIPDFTNSKLLDEAAARIEALEAALREAGDIYREATSLARARIEVLEAALREIAIYNDNITKTIRAALAPEQDK